MGLEPLAVNVSDLSIARPNRRGPGGDRVGADAVIGTGLNSCFTEEDRILRRADGREVVLTGQFFIDPILDAAGTIVPVLVGDVVSWTDLQGAAKADQEIVAVRGITDCSSRLDVVQFSIGQLLTEGR